MKKTKQILLLFVVAIGIFATIMLVACQKDKQPDNEPSHSGDKQTTMQEVYTTNIVASLGLLSNVVNEEKTNLVNKNVAAPRMLLANTTPTSDVDYDELVEYVKGLSSLVQNIEDKFEVVESDKTEYATKIVYHGQDMEGKEETYVIYYNEVPLQTQDVDDDHDDDKDDDYDDDKDDDFDDDKDNDFDDDKDLDEVETTLTGVAYVGTKEYTVTGSKEIEQDEVEIELQIRYDRANYIEISQEKENGEIEYEYAIVKNNRTVKEFGVEFKTRNNRSSVEIEEEVNGLEREIEIYQTNEDKLMIEVKDNKSNQTFVCQTFTKEDGTVGYRFTNQQTNEVIEK